jgi:hypothetical protein
VEHSAEWLAAKWKHWKETCPSAALSTTNPIWFGLEPGPPQWETGD